MTTTVMIDGATCHEGGGCAYDGNCKSRDLLKVQNTYDQNKFWGLCGPHAQKYGGKVVGTLTGYRSEDTEGDLW